MFYLQTHDSKLDQLKRYIAEKGRNGAVIAFSGGVDSSTLAAVSHQILGDKAVAVTAKSPTYPSQELAYAKKIAKEIGIKLFIIETNELLNEEFSKNPENRCYYCKKELLGHLKAFAHELGFKAVFEGTNYSDLGDHRPGYKAVQEAPRVYSPWVTTKYTKDEIRSLAKHLHLSVYNKSAVACLATRIPFNEKITAEKLLRVDKAEEAVRKVLGALQIRVRDHDGLARIEVPKEDITAFCKPEASEKVTAELKRLGFKYVTLDLEGFRSGSMLKTLEP